EEGSAGGAHRGHLLRSRTRHDGLAAPVALRAGLFAGGPAGVLLGRLAGALGRTGGRRAGVGASRGRLASRVTPIRVVARRRTRTGPRILARAVRQRTRQLAPPPRQLLKFRTRHRRKVGPLDIVQVWDVSARHKKRRIQFAPVRNPPDRGSNENGPPPPWTRSKGGGVTGYDQ